MTPDAGRTPMKRLASLFAALLAAAVAPCVAAPSLDLTINRGRIYLGESIVAEVSLRDFTGTPPVPSFSGGSPARVEYGGSRSFTQSYTSIVNGRRESSVTSSTVFTFVFTPEQAGAFSTGDVSVDIGGGKSLSAKAKGAVVVAPQELDYVSLSLSCPDKSVTIESGFTIRLEVGLRSLPEPFGGYEPFSAKSPLALSARFLDFPETQGLKSPSPSDALNPFVANSPSLPFFTINGYTASSSPFAGFPSFASPFADQVAKFRPEPEKRELGGTNWWFYTFSFDFTALEEGEYTFGPVSLKGNVFSTPPGGGEPAPSDIYAVAPSIAVKVLPPPEEGRPDCFCGGVGRSMQVKSSLDTQKCKVGDPIILTVDISGDVNPMSLRPPPVASLPGLSANFRIYGDHVESESIPNGKRFRFRLRPLSSGTLEIPPIQAAFYDIRGSRYATVASDAIPIQVEATTQISVSGAPETDDSGTILPEGIIWGATDDFSIRIPFLGSTVDCGEILTRMWPALLLVPPLLWLAVLAGRASLRDFRAYRAATRVRRNSARARRAFARAARRGLAGAGADKAVSALRDFASAILDDDSMSLTSAEAMAGLAAKGLPSDASRTFSTAFSNFEGMQFGTGGGQAESVPCDAGQVDFAMKKLATAAAAPWARKSRTPAMRLCCSMIVAALAAALACVAVQRAAQRRDLGRAALPNRIPPAFDWDRVQGAMASASDTASFTEAARLYSELVSSGYATYPLLHNLGVAMLLSGEPRAAAAALDLSANWTGALGEVRMNRMLASKLLSGSASLPLQFYAFPWHFFIGLKWRMAIAAASWCLIWILLAFGLKRKAGKPFRRAAFATAILAAGFAISVAVSCARIADAKSVLTYSSSGGAASSGDPAATQADGGLP